jgi:hypothetical protein
MAIVAAPSGWLSDKMTGSGLVSTRNARRIFQSLSVFVPALGLVWVSYSGCNLTMVLTAMCTCVAANAFTYVGFHVSFK